MLLYSQHKANRDGPLPWFNSVQAVPTLVSAPNCNLNLGVFRLVLGDWEYGEYEALYEPQPLSTSGPWRNRVLMPFLFSVQSME